MAEARNEPEIIEIQRQLLEILNFQRLLYSEREIKEQERESFKELLHANPALAETLDSQQQSLLHLASANGHIEIVRILTVARPEMCLARNQDGANSFHVAAMRGKVKALEQLLRANPHAARARVDNSERETILHLCVKYNQRDCLEMLLEYYLGDEFVNAKDNDDNTILHLAVADRTDRRYETYNLASANEPIEIVRVITVARPEMCLACDRDGANPLHLAVMRGKVKVLEQLLQANPHAARARVENSERETILHLCIKYNQLVCLKILLDKYIGDDELVNAKDKAGNTILHLIVADRRYETYNLASANEPIEIVKVLTAARPEMCLACDRDGANPLHLAAMRGKVKVLEQLLQANPHAARARLDNSGRETILHLCVKYNQLVCLQILLDKYIRDDELVNAKDNAGNTILHVIVADRRYKTYNLASAPNGHIEIVRVLIAARPEMCLARDQDGANPLHLAAMGGKVNVLELLLQANPQAALDRVDNSERETILHLCVKYNQLVCLQILLDKYIRDDELVNAKDNAGNTILHLIVADRRYETYNLASAPNGHIEIVRVLIAARPEMCLARDQDGANPLHLAAMGGKVKVLELLIQGNPHAALDRVDNSERETILHLCVKYNQLVCLQILLDKYIRDDELVNAKDNAGNTILHLVIADRKYETYNLASAPNGDIEIVRVLITVRPEMCLACDRNGANPLHLAVMRGKVKVLEQLLHANPHAARAKVENSERETILHLCVKYNQLVCLQILLDKYFSDDEFVNAKDNAGNTILHLIVADRRYETYNLASAPNGHIEIVRVLIAARPEMCLARDQDGANPLHLAAMRGKVKVLELLLQANPHAARARVDNSERKTILHLCVKYNQLVCLQILLDNYFRSDGFVNAKDNAGTTILHLAVADRRHEIVRYVVFGTKIDVNAVNASQQTAMDILLIDKEKGTRLEGLDRRIQRYLEFRDAKTAREADILDPKEIAEKRNGILVAAALMATLGFQAGVAPPGGVWQDDKDGHKSGKAVMASNHPILYSFFLCYNIVGFISSLGTLVLMITDIPFKPGRYSRWTFITMSTTITSIAIAYSISLVVVSPPLERGPMTKTVLAPAASVILLLLLIAIIAGNIKRVNRAVERAVKSVEWAVLHACRAIVLCCWVEEYFSDTDSE